MKISLVITVLDEEATIDLLLAGIAQQTLPPAEIIIVDGGSTDTTSKKIKVWQKTAEIGKKIKVFKKKGNRSVGRNFGISKAKHSWLAITDAGCIPAENWLAQLAATQQQTKARVIAGYYVGLPQSRFQQAVVPYVLVMPNQVKPDKFLPATRSMMIHKSIWKKVDKFDEQLNHNEDYDFAKKIDRAKIEIAFARQALVGWLPRKNLQSFWTMIYRFALGDVQAGIIRPKVILVFLRYAIMLTIFLWAVLTNTLTDTGVFFPTMLLVYSIWAVWKNKRHAPEGWLWLPILQITADLAVMRGSLQGVWEKLKTKKN
jgi:glycosyltransferase involved in cell wall biosynthesis